MWRRAGSKKIRASDAIVHPIRSPCTHPLSPSASSKQIIRIRRLQLLHAALPRLALTSVPTSRSRFICFVIGTSDFFLHLPSLANLPFVQEFGPSPALPAKSIFVTTFGFALLLAPLTLLYTHSCFIADIFHVAVMHLSDRQMSQFQMTRARATYPSPLQRAL